MSSCGFAHPQTCSFVLQLHEALCPHLPPRAEIAERAAGAWATAVVALEPRESEEKRKARRSKDENPLAPKGGAWFKKQLVESICFTPNSSFLGVRLPPTFRDLQQDVSGVGVPFLRVRPGTGVAPRRRGCSAAGRSGRGFDPHTGPSAPNTSAPHLVAPDVGRNRPVSQTC